MSYKVIIQGLLLKMKRMKIKNSSSNNQPQAIVRDKIESLDDDADVQDECPSEEKKISKKEIYWITSTRYVSTQLY